MYIKEWDFLTTKNFMADYLCMLSNVKTTVVTSAVAYLYSNIPVKGIID